MFYTKILPFRRLCNIFILYPSRKIHYSFEKFSRITNSLQFIQFEDSRLQKYLKSIHNEYLVAQQSEKFVQNYKYLEKIALLTQEIKKIEDELKELDTFISELKEKDDEMFTTAKSEKADIEEKLIILKLRVLKYLVPDEIIDDKDIIMELAPGIGGQEAMLFTKNMFDMYCQFVQWKGWSFEILKYDGTDIGGLKSGHIAIAGRNAYKILKYECGVHRVQRIPKTEKAGRIHTSTMTVAILPQPSDIDIVINPQDIELEFKRSSGAGGQHVNTTDSCVRIYHKASGLVAESQMERDQHRNRELAMKSLRAKLYERELEALVKQTTSSRKLQIGTAARSEKVRTYNFVQDRITDHKAHVTLYDIESYFKGDELLNKMLENLQDWNSSQILMEILQKYE